MPIFCRELRRTLDNARCDGYSFREECRRRTENGVLHQCGAKLESGAVFCRECGRKLTRETPRAPLAKENRAPKLLYILPLWILVAGVVMYFIYNMNRYVTDVRNSASYFSPMLLTVRIGQAALVGILPAALQQLYVVHAGTPVAITLFNTWSCILKTGIQLHARVSIRFLRSALPDRCGRRASDGRSPDRKPPRRTDNRAGASAK